MKSAVLFLIFNRPETTVQVFEAIRLAKPPKLYVAADGPRLGKAGEQERCDLARQIATNVDWPCEVHTLFQGVNLGCKKGVSTGIDWFFDHEEEGIILEDDVLPMPSFFSYCDALLERFRDDDNIGMITGSNLISKHMNTKASYIVTNVPLIWGWASWRRAWNSYDANLKDWPTWHENGSLQKTLHHNLLLTSYWTDAFDRVHSGKLDTWDYQWLFSCWRSKLLTIMPTKNLTDNLGYGVESTHTSSSKPQFLLESRPEDLSFPLIHPDTLRPDWQIDQRIFQRVHGVNWLGFLRRYLRPIHPRRLFNNRHAH
jgi:hypothetical protein